MQWIKSVLLLIAVRKTDTMENWKASKEKVVIKRLLGIEL